MFCVLRARLKFRERRGSRISNNTIQEYGANMASGSGIPKRNALPKLTKQASYNNTDTINALVSSRAPLPGTSTTLRATISTMAASQSLSYLIARDPSLLATNNFQLKQIRLNLEKELSPAEKVEHIQVYLRIKSGDMQIYEIENNTLICNIPHESQTAKNLKSDDIFAYTYAFSNIFGPDVNQAQLFNGIVKPNIIEFINGRDFNLMTYGASGSGKTYTVIGTVMEPGILPRSLEYIFRTLKDIAPQPVCKPLPNGDVRPLSPNLFKMEQENKQEIISAVNLDHDVHSKTYRNMQQRLSSESVGVIKMRSSVSLSIWVSFFEIYNEHIYDLLKPLPKNKIRPILKLGKSKNQNIYVKDLSSIYVKNGLEAYEILQYGLQNLNYAATAVNSHSSRSHSIFMIKLVQTPIAKKSETYIKTLCFCDIAGLERSKKTKNVGVRLKESNNINKSLLVLSRCIQTIKSSQDSNKNQPVPFRDSKLTQLFQSGLSGNDNIALIVTLNPARNMFDESLHSLNLSTFAKDIKIKKPTIQAIQKSAKSDDSNRGEDEGQSGTNVFDDSEEVERLKDMIVHLYQELETLKTDHAKDIVEQRQAIARMCIQSAEERRVESEERHNNVIKRYQAEIKLLKAQLDDDVVVTNDDSDEENSPDEVSFLSANLQKLKEENIALKQKLEQQETDSLKLMELRLENTKLKQDIEEGRIALTRARRMTIVYEKVAEEEWNKRKQLLLQQEQFAGLELGSNEDPEEPEEDNSDNE